MGLENLSGEGVQRAIAEFDDIGRERFLERYGFAPARDYFLVHDGREYDSKAIVGAAHGYSGPGLQALRSNEFVGGEATVRRRLEQLGFAVRRTSAAPVEEPEALDPLVRAKIQGGLDRLLRQGRLRMRDELETYYARFREKFGPEQLRRLDGVELLESLHAHGNRDSLVYWLEFKDDDEFPAIFGGIGGGSALKFGIYRSQETGEWMTGSSTSQRAIPIGEAIEIASKHRDQLIAGHEVLRSLSGDSDEDYRGLQEDLRRVAPAVCDSAWGHKYLSLLHPDRLDDYHVENWQRFQLVRILQVPPVGRGRFLSAGRFVRAANELRVPLNHLTLTLNEVNGAPRRYWRIGTSIDDHSLWQLMRDQGVIAVGWDQLGDLADIHKNQPDKDRLKELLQSTYSWSPPKTGKENQQLFNFLTAVDADDIVVAAHGKQILGIGRVTGGYQYDQSSDPIAPHHRSVEWLSVGEWELPETEGLQTTLYGLRKEQNFVAIERRLLTSSGTPAKEQPRPGRARRARLEGVPGRIQAILERKGQAILYGPPGTGKTYWALRTARDLASYERFGTPYSAIVDSERSEIEPALVRICTFHPAYGYEDFIEGYRPTSPNGSLVFEHRDGIFKRICSDAAANPDGRYYLVIDEINRGDIPRIFGELLTFLEADKRGMSLELPVSGERFAIPPNLHVIGTMNTADRSIALLDTALRRRFGFVELMPDTALLDSVVLQDTLPLGRWLSALNTRIRTYVGRDARNLQVGHAFFLSGGKPIDDVRSFVRVLAEDIVPLLEEYCYEDYTVLAQILGKGLVDEQRQVIREEMFEPARRDDLLLSLLDPELATSLQAVAAEETDDADGSDDLDDAPDSGETDS